LGVSFSCKMETVTLAYLQGLSPDARAGLGCVKVEGYSHTQLAVLVPHHVWQGALHHCDLQWMGGRERKAAQAVLSM
jgi:hypothetical protein